jgi:hypothetical protein
MSKQEIFNVLDNTHHLVHLAGYSTPQCVRVYNENPYHFSRLNSDMDEEQFPDWDITTLGNVAFLAYFGHDKFKKTYKIGLISYIKWFNKHYTV